MDGEETCAGPEFPGGKDLNRAQVKKLGSKHANSRFPNTCNESSNGLDLVAGDDFTRFFLAKTLNYYKSEAKK
jgi:hypothetical protein